MGFAGRPSSVGVGFMIDGTFRGQEMSLAESEEAAGAYLKHAHPFFGFVDKKIVDVTDLVSVSIDHLTSADILMIFGEHEVGVVQPRKFAIVRRVICHASTPSVTAA
jgi:hypothetical protein